MAFQKARLSGLRYASDSFMKQDHVHVEASVFASILLVVVILIDHFVDIVDGHPIKPIAYIAAYFMLYAALYFFFRKLWRN